MSKLTNVTTLVTKNLINDFLVLQKSLELTNPDTKILVLCEQESADIIERINNPNIIIFNELKDLNYAEIKVRGKAFLDLVLTKCDIIRHGLKQFGETLFVDSDIVFLNEYDEDNSKDLLLSQHHIFPHDEAKYGKYNVGYLYVNNDTFPEWLKETTLTRSKFFEQEGLIHAEQDFNMDKFSMNHNFGWWRLFQCTEREERRKKFGIGNTIFYDKKPLVSVHTHILNDDPSYKGFNDMILKLLQLSKNTKHQDLLRYILRIKQGINVVVPKIIIPDPSVTDHSGDTFRELARLWEKEGLCQIEYTKQTQHVWMNAIGDILLYDRPTRQWLRDTKFNFGLFGNPKPNPLDMKESTWTFWGRRPELMEEVRTEGIKPLEDRTIESIFLGKVENQIQEKNRTTHDWSTSIEMFEMPIRGQYKYSQKGYLELVNKSKYGLCLAGFGDKCNREIELFSLGTVPIITDGVDLTYYNELVEGKHYLKVSNPSQIKPLLASITDDKWNEMSKAGLDWYDENCSPIGSFKLTMKIIK